MCFRIACGKVDAPGWKEPNVTVQMLYRDRLFLHPTHLRLLLCGFTYFRAMLDVLWRQAVF